MTIGVLALVGVTPERVAALTAAGYAVREGRNMPTGQTPRGRRYRQGRADQRPRSGLSGDEMACCSSSRSSAPWARA